MPSSSHASRIIMILSGVIGIFRPSPPARLSECSMVHALCTISDTTKQNILTFLSLLAVRMRVCFSIL